MGDFLEILQGQIMARSLQGTALMLKDAGTIMLPSIRRIFGQGIDIEWQQNINRLYSNSLESLQKLEN